MTNRRNLLALAAAGLAVTGGGALFWPHRDSETGAVSFDLGAARAQGSIAIEDMRMGDPNAPVEVIEYASYTCPHCANFHNDTFKAFKAEYIDTGKVNFIYREVYFDRYGLWASMMARCGGGTKFFGISDLLYDSQEAWSRQADPAAVAESIKRIGLQAGLDQVTVDACMQDAAMAESLYAWYQGNAERDGIRSTPSFMINGEMHAGNLGLAAIGRLVDEAAS
ncbi:MAG: DsbA family protein [Pseudomonadota bacterium]